MLLSFPRVTEMFQFTRFPPPPLCVQGGVPVHDDRWVSPFGHPRIKGRSAPPRGLSQPPTSFFGSHCQGIHRWPFVAWDSFYKDARARYEILKGRAPARLAGGSEVRARRKAPPLPSQRKTGRELRPANRAGQPSECVNWEFLDCWSVDQRPFRSSPHHRRDRLKGQRASGLRHDSLERR